MHISAYSIHTIVPFTTNTNGEVRKLEIIPNIQFALNFIFEQITLSPTDGTFIVWPNGPGPYRWLLQLIGKTAFRPLNLEFQPSSPIYRFLYSLVMIFDILWQNSSFSKVFMFFGEASVFILDMHFCKTWLFSNVILSYIHFTEEDCRGHEPCITAIGCYWIFF